MADAQARHHTDATRTPFAICAAATDGESTGGGHRAPEDKHKTSKCGGTVSHQPVELRARGWRPAGAHFVADREPKHGIKQVP